MIRKSLVLAAIIITAISTISFADRSQYSPSTSQHPGGPATSVKKPPPDRRALSRLDEYLSFAERESPALRAAYQKWLANRERSGYAGSLPDPVASYTYFGEQVETRVGPQEQRFSLRQSIPWFGTLGARREVAEREADTAYQRYRSRRTRLFYEVKAAYYEYYYLGRKLAITRENLELLRFWETIVRARYRVALTQHPDLIQVQVELGKLENRLRTIEDMVSPAAARLRAAANLPDTLALPLPEAIVNVEMELDREAILDAVSMENPDLKSRMHAIERAEAGLRLAGKANRPDVTLGFDYIQTGDALDPGLDGSGKDPWMVSVGVSLPIWFGANSARKREAEAERRSAEYAFSDAGNRLAALTERIMFEYEDALRQVRLFRDGLIPKAEQSLNASYTAYTAGEADLLNLIDAQRQLLEFQLQLERSKSDLAIRRSELEMLTGKEL